MKSPNFQELYRKTYSALGFNLTEQDGISDTALKVAEAKIGSRIPQSLRDYYVVAGRETKLNTAFNRLLPPEDWEVHDGKVVFMTENQNAVAWGAGLKTQPKNPKIFQNPIVKGELGEWFEEHRSCSRFMVFMLHLQSSYGGGLPHRASALVSQTLIAQLDAKWFFVAEVGGTRAYSGPGQAICILKWPELFNKTDGWRLFAGATNETSLDDIAKQLEIDWED